MKRSNNRRDVNGIILLDKATGLSSNAALQEVKRLFNANKAGHTGSLDPLASGMLPICLGEATKVSAFLLDADKRYRVRCRLGVRTTTADAEGEIIEERSVDGITAASIAAVLPRFTGQIEQIPPMYSALKHQGQRLYHLARQGIEVDRQPRTLFIHELLLLGLENGECTLDVHCSKGTYVRTLAEDIGAALGCGAHVSALRRTGLGPYQENQMLTLDQLIAIGTDGYAALDAALLPIETALLHWPEVNLSADAAFFLGQGQAVQVPHAPTQGWVRLYNGARNFLGMGEIQDDGLVAPRRLMNVKHSG
jgi:tRNA pseudouridine55 synthase